MVAEEGKCASQYQDDGEEGVEDYDLEDYADYEDEEDPVDYEYEDGDFIHGEL